MMGSTRSRERESHPRRPPGQASRGKSSPEPDEPDRSHDDAPRRKRLSGSRAVELAKAHMMELTGHVCESVSSLTRGREGWRVVLEIVELERIPQTTDILASYVVELDEDGELMSYERVHRYYRNEVSGEQ